MKALLRQVDEALASIYQVNHHLKAQDFVLHPQEKTPRGVLYIHSPPDRSEEDLVELGLCFNPLIHYQLESVTHESFHLWTHDQIQAFSVMVEEVSHFRFFVFHANANRKMSQLELEFQSEVDKFLLFFFLLIHSPNNLSFTFDEIFKQVFETFSLGTELEYQARERYQMANQMAREYIQKNRTLFLSPEHFAELFCNLRKFYRMSSEERFSICRRL